MTHLTTRRRVLLGAIGSGAVALTGGCLRNVRSLTGWESTQQVRLRIKTVPDDADPYALTLARTVADWFRAAGIDARITPMSEQELHRQTLLRNEFDLFLMRLPPRFNEPDALYTLFHSQFAEDPGWQNPFGYANLDVDDLLETQRRTTGSQRRDALRQLQLTVGRTQPFTLLTVPDDIRAVRTTNYSNWRSASLGSSLGYLSLERADGIDSEADGTLRVASTDRRATMNLNPLSVEFRRTGTLTGLVYDPLGYVFEDRLLPWLAETWEFSEDSSPTARVTIREGATWHDGEALTADDVTFTYRLLSDTTLGSDSDEEEETAPLPSPRYRGRSSLVTNVDARGDRTAEFQFADVTPEVARRAFTVPILPKHIWEDRTDVASIAGVQTGSVTEALVTNNIPPVGSGPLQFVRNTPREEVVFERFDDHVLRRENSPTNDLVDQAGDVAFDTLSVQVVGSDVTAAEMVADDTVDVTGTPVGADVTPRIGRSSGSELLVQRSPSAYVLGYNTRNQHLNNPRFRHTLARLIDGEYIAETVVDGYGGPAVGPLWDTEWYPSELRWEKGNPIAEFLGSEGEIDIAQARAAFREAGYRYEDGKLIGGRT